MDKRRLGRSDLAITPIGLGTWAIGGGDWVCGWGPQKDAESIATIRRAIERGINWIDTAGVYGLGHAESIVARGLRDVPRSERPLIFTSCSLEWDELGNVSHNLRPESIRREAEGSLRRLDVEVIDGYFLAWPSWRYSRTGHDPGRLEDAWAAMAALQREGKVRIIGVGNCDVDRLELLDRIAPVTSVQHPYSLGQREIEPHLLPFCQNRGIGVIAYSPMQSGLLTGCMTASRTRLLPHNDWRRWSDAFKEPALSRAQVLVDELRATGLRRSAAPGAVAVAWVLRHPGIGGAVVGARRPGQIDDTVTALSVRFTPEDLEALDRASDELGVRVPGLTV